MKLSVALHCRVWPMTLGVVTGTFYQKRARRSDE